MYERLLDKTRPPAPQDLPAILGQEAYGRLQRLEATLALRYDLTRELRFPFGSQYGWGLKYSHKRQHLAYVFLEQGAITLTLQLGDGAVDAVEAVLPTLLPETRALWQGRYPCGQRGGWIHYRLLTDPQMLDALALIALKRKPVNQGPQAGTSSSL